MDIEKVGEEMELDIVWSGDDIRREGKKDRSSRYDENDMWGCIGIVGNGDRIVGVKCSEEEEKDDIVGCELVVERDGLGSGRGLLKWDVERERCVEFSKEEGKEQDELQCDSVDKIMKGEKGNGDGKEEKYNKKEGDI